MRVLFSVLQEVGNLYLADPTQDLKSLFTDLSVYHGVLGLDDILELLAARTDYSTLKEHVESKESCLLM